LPATTLFPGRGAEKFSSEEGVRVVEDEVEEVDRVEAMRRAWRWV
jgi:hypothetical protein